MINATKPLAAQAAEGDQLVPLISDIMDGLAKIKCLKQSPIAQHFAALNVRITPTDAGGKITHRDMEQISKVLILGESTQQPTKIVAGLRTDNTSFVQSTLRVQSCCTQLMTFQVFMLNALQHPLYAPQPRLTATYQTYRTIMVKQQHFAQTSPAAAVDPSKSLIPRMAYPGNTP